MVTAGLCGGGGPPEGPRPRQDHEGPLLGPGRGRGGLLLRAEGRFLALHQRDPQQQRDLGVLADSLMEVWSHGQRQRQRQRRPIPCAGELETAHMVLPLHTWMVGQHLEHCIQFRSLQLKQGIVEKVQEAARAPLLLAPPQRQLGPADLPPPAPRLASLPLPGKSSATAA